MLLLFNFDSQKLSAPNRRTVREFCPEIFEVEIRVVYEAFGVEILIFTFGIPYKYLASAIALPYFWQNK
jgi:hypothetical protein